MSGAGGAPRFTMTSTDGQVLSTPEGSDSSIQEVPALETGAADGRHRFAVTAGDYKGVRRLRAIVVQGQGATESAIADRYRVAQPARLESPREVSGWRDDYTAHARWTGVNGARSYLVQIVMRKEGRLLASYVRHVGGNRRSVAIADFPGGDRATVKVYPINWGGKLGHPGLATFATNPTSPHAAILNQTRRIGGRLEARRTQPARAHASDTRSDRFRGSECQHRRLSRADLDRRSQVGSFLRPVVNRRDRVDRETLSQGRQLPFPA